MCVGVVSFLLASFIPSIIKGLLFFYSVWVPSILTVAIFSIYLKKHHWFSAFSAMSMGMVSSILWGLTAYSKAFPAILFGLLLSLVAYGVSHYILVIQKED